MAPSVTYNRQGGILLLSYFCFTDLHLFKGFCLVNGFVSNVHPSGRNLITWPFGFVSGWICLCKDIKRETFYWFQERTNSSNTFTGGTSSSFRCSMGEEAFVHIEFPGDNCLVGGSGWLCRVLPTWAQAFLGLGILLLLKLCAGQGLLYWAVLASLFYCSIRPSSVGICHSAEGFVSHFV